MSRSNLQGANLKLARELHTLDDSIGYLLGRAYTEGHRNLHKELADLDLTPQQHVIIMKLHELGEASQNLLGRSVGMKPVTDHGIISRLSSGGLIEVRGDDADRRPERLWSENWYGGRKWRAPKVWLRSARTRRLPCDAYSEKCFRKTLVVMDVE